MSYFYIGYGIVISGTVGEYIESQEEYDYLIQGYFEDSRKWGGNGVITYILPYDKLFIGYIIETFKGNNTGDLSSVFRFQNKDTCNYRKSFWKTVDNMKISGSLRQCINSQKVKFATFFSYCDCY